MKYFGKTVRILINYTTVKSEKKYRNRGSWVHSSIPFVSVLSLPLTFFNFIYFKSSSHSLYIYAHTKTQYTDKLRTSIDQKRRIKRVLTIAPPPALPEMTVFGHSSGGGKQVVPVDYETEVSQRLLESAHSNDIVSALECIADPLVDVNYVGAVLLNVRKAELLCRDESPIEIRFESDKFMTEVTPLFLAVHNGNVALVKKLLVTLFNLFHFLLSDLKNSCMLVLDSNFSFIYTRNSS